MKILLIFMLYVFTFDTNPRKEYPQIDLNNVVQRCGDSRIQQMLPEQSSMLSRSCKGEIRYCGNGNYRCIRVSYGLFGCCDSYPARCPGTGPEVPGESL